MSANNWTVCPACRKKQIEEKEAKLIELGEAYGKMLPKDYLKLLKEAEKPVCQEDNMREDYQLGIDEDGEFEISYRASCQDCNFSFSYKHKEQVKLEKSK